MCRSPLWLLVCAGLYVRCSEAQPQDLNQYQEEKCQTSFLQHQLHVDSLPTHLSPRTAAEVKHKRQAPVNEQTGDATAEAARAVKLASAAAESAEEAAYAACLAAGLPGCEKRTSTLSPTSPTAQPAPVYGTTTKAASVSGTRGSQAETTNVRRTTTKAASASGTAETTPAPRITTKALHEPATTESRTTTRVSYDSGTTKSGSDTTLVRRKGSASTTNSYETTTAPGSWRTTTKMSTTTQAFPGTSTVGNSATTTETVAKGVKGEATTTAKKNGATTTESVAKGGTTTVKGLGVTTATTVAVPGTRGGGETPSETQTETVTETEQTPASETPTETVTETEQEPASETQTETVTETEQTPASETPTETATETEQETPSETQTETVTETEQAPASETQTETMTETEQAPASETQTETVTETEQEPAPQPEQAPETNNIAVCQVRIDDNILKVVYNGEDITDTLTPSWAFNAWWAVMQFQVDYVPGATLIVYGSDNGGGSVPYQSGFSIQCSGPLSGVSNQEAWSAYGSSNPVPDQDEHLQGQGAGWSAVINAYTDGQVQGTQPMWGQANFGYQVFLWSEPSQPATCQVRIDDNILGVGYNGQDYTDSLTPQWANDDWWAVQSFTVNYSPGAALVVYGNDNGGGQILAQCGFSIFCTGALSFVNENSAWAAYGSTSPLSPYDPHRSGYGGDWNTPINAYSGGRVPGTQPMWPAQYEGYAAFRWDEVAVTCKILIDDHINYVSYNGQDYTQWLASDGYGPSGGQQMSLTVPYIPGAYLVVYGQDDGMGQNFWQCGFSISCPTESPLAGTSELSAWSSYGVNYPLSSYDEHMNGGGDGWAPVIESYTDWRVADTQPMWAPSRTPVGFVAFRWQG